MLIAHFSCAIKLSAIGYGYKPGGGQKGTKILYRDGGSVMVRLFRYNLRVVPGNVELASADGWCDEGIYQQTE